jgi:hypothetical protein
LMDLNKVWNILDAWPSLRVEFLNQYPAAVFLSARGRAVSPVWDRRSRPRVACCSICAKAFLAVESTGHYETWHQYVPRARRESPIDRRETHTHVQASRPYAACFFAQGSRIARTVGVESANLFVSHVKNDLVADPDVLLADAPLKR